MENGSEQNKEGLGGVGLGFVGPADAAGASEQTRTRRVPSASPSTFTPPSWSSCASRPGTAGLRLRCVRVAVEGRCVRVEVEGGSV